MTFVKFDPELMQAYINDLNSYAEAADLARSSIQTSSRNNDHPVGSVDEATRTSPLFMGAAVGAAVGSGTYASTVATTMAAPIAALTSLAEELGARRQAIIDLNSSGVSITAPDGTPAYYLPDGAADTLTNVRAYNTQAATTATADAAALSQAKSSRDGTADDGRTTDQILTDIAEYQDSPAYGAAFVNAYGIDKFVELPIDMRWHYTTATKGQKAAGYGDYEIDEEAVDKADGTLGHLLAAATQTGTPPSGFDSWSQALYDTVTAKGHRGRVSSLNELLAASGAVYNTDTLVDLATKMENQDKTNGGYYDGDGTVNDDAIYGWYNDDYGGLFSGGGFYNEGRAFRSGSMDPMYGVLSAMGNNPDAALKYLAGSGSTDPEGNWQPDSTITDRWEFLKSRTWDPDVGLDGLTAAVAGVSSKRVQSQDATDERAAWATEQGVEHFAGLSEKSFSSTAKNNVALTLGNSMTELEQVADGVKDSSGARPTAWSKGAPSSLPGYSSSDLSRLVSVVGTDDAALTTLSGAAGNYSQRRTETIIDRYPGAMAGQDEQFSTELKNGSHADGELLGYIRQSAINKRSDDAETAQKIDSTLLSAFTTGLSAAGPAGQGLSTALSLSTPWMPSPDDPRTAVSDLTAEAEDTTHGSMMAQLSNAGRLPEEAYTDLDGNNYSQFYEWMDDNNTIDFDMVRGSEEYRGQFTNWLKDASIPFVNIHDTFTTGTSQGERLATKEKRNG